MKTIFRISLLLLLVLALVGCVSPVRVDYDHDAASKLQSYKCFTAVSYTHLTLPTNREV